MKNIQYITRLGWILDVKAILPMLLQSYFHLLI